MEKSTDETTLHTTSELTCIETEHHHTQPKCCRVASERKQLSNTSCTSFQSRQRSNCPKYSEHVSLQLSPSLMKQHTWHLLHRLHFTQFLVLGVFVVLCLSVPLIGAEQRVSLAVLYGLPDAVASVGHQFEYTIPSDAFSGDVQHYEITALGGDSLPEWLTFNPFSRSLKGIPLPGAERTWLLQVRAYGHESTEEEEEEYADDVFQLQIVSQKTSKSQKHALSMFEGGTNWRIVAKSSTTSKEKAKQENHSAKLQIGSVHCPPNSKKLWANLVPSVDLLSLPIDLRFKVCQSVGEYFSVPPWALSVVGPSSATILQQSRPFELTEANKTNVIAFPFGCGRFNLHSDYVASLINLLNSCLIQCKYSHTAPDVVLAVAEWFMSSESSYKPSQQHRGKRRVAPPPDNPPPGAVTDDVFSGDSPTSFPSSVSDDVFSGDSPTSFPSSVSDDVFSSDSTTSFPSSVSDDVFSGDSPTSFPSSVSDDVFSGDSPTSFSSSVSDDVFSSDSTTSFPSPTSFPSSVSDDVFSGDSPTSFPSSVSDDVFSGDSPTSFSSLESSTIDETETPTFTVVSTPTTSSPVLPTSVLSDVQTSSSTSVEQSSSLSTGTTESPVVRTPVASSPVLPTVMVTLSDSVSEETPVFGTSSLVTPPPQPTVTSVSSESFISDFPSLTTSETATSFLLSESQSEEPTLSLTSVQVSESTEESDLIEPTPTSDMTTDIDSSDLVESTPTSASLSRTTEQIDLSDSPEPTLISLGTASSSAIAGEESSTSLVETSSSIVEETPSLDLPTTQISSVVSISTSPELTSIEETSPLESTSGLVSEIPSFPPLTSSVEETPPLDSTSVEISETFSVTVSPSLSSVEILSSSSSDVLVTESTTLLSSLILSSPVADTPEPTLAPSSVIESSFSETETTVFSSSLSLVGASTLPVSTSEDPTLVVETPLTSPATTTTSLFPLSSSTQDVFVSLSSSEVGPFMSDFSTSTEILLDSLTSVEDSVEATSPVQETSSIPTSSMMDESISSILSPSVSEVFTTVFDMTTIFVETSSLSSFVLPDITTSAFDTPIATPTPSLTPSPSPLPPPNTPPMLVKPVGLLEVLQGQPFMFPIPDDTFIDHEDGSTSNLTLLFLDEKGGTNFTWIDLEGQQLLGVAFFPLTGVDVVFDFVFILLAVDSGGEYTEDFITIRIFPSKDPGFNLSITIEGDFDAFQRNISQKVELSRLIAQVHNSKLSDIRVSNYADGSIVFTYSSYSIESFDCESQRQWSSAVVTGGDPNVYTQLISDVFAGKFVLTGNPVFAGLCSIFPVLNVTEEPTDVILTTETRNRNLVLFLAIMIPGIVLALVVVLVTMLAVIQYRARRKERKNLTERVTFERRRPAIFEDEMDPWPQNRRNYPRLLEDEGPPGSIRSHVPDTLPPSLETNEDRLINSPPPAYQLPPDDYFAKYDDHIFDLEFEDYS